VCTCAILCAVTYDIVFALDDSSNVPASGWTEMLNLMSSYVDYFNIGPGQTRVGVVRYSDTATTAFGLDAYRTDDSLKTAISQLQHFSRSSQRNLASAFQLTLSSLLVTGQRYFAAPVGTYCIYQNSLLLYNSMYATQNSNRRCPIRTCAM